MPYLGSLLLLALDSPVAETCWASVSHASQVLSGLNLAEAICLWAHGRACLADRLWIMRHGPLHLMVGPGILVGAEASLVVLR